MRSRRSILSRALLVLGTLAAAPIQASIAVAGTVEVELTPPISAAMYDYQNVGYRMRVRGDKVRVSVQLSPLSSAASFQPMRVEPGLADLEALARRLTADETLVYDAVSRILAWVASNIRYDLDRAASQDAAAVLERRSAYCTGAARLSVALLRAVGIAAREVPGYVVDADGGVEPEGYHRWIEVEYPDLGWVFSDPLHSHHFVPPSYVRLADTRVMSAQPTAASRILHRFGRVTPVDLTPGPPGVHVRRNSAKQQAAALMVRGPANRFERVTLVGPDRQWRAPFERGETIFLGLQPGVYTVIAEAGGEIRAQRQLRLTGRVRGLLELAVEGESRLAPSRGQMW